MQNLFVMIKFNFTKENQDKLFQNFKYEDHPKTRQKNFVLYLKSFGLKHKEITDICRISKQTLVNYLKEYKDKGIDSFMKHRWQGQVSQLLNFKDLIEKDFDENPPKTTNEAQYRIEQLTGIKRSPTQIREFMKNKLSLKYLKAGSVPGNGKDDDYEKECERQEFKKNYWNHAWRKQKKENE